MAPVPDNDELVGLSSSTPTGKYLNQLLAPISTLSLDPATEVPLRFIQGGSTITGAMADSGRTRVSASDTLAFLDQQFIPMVSGNPPDQSKSLNFYSVNSGQQLRVAHQPLDYSGSGENYLAQNQVLGHDASGNWVWFNLRECPPPP
jgi:hypothetical protein